MLTGQKPFVGDDVSDTLAAVLRAEVNLDELPDATPARLRQVLTACLQRDPKQRVHDIADVRLAMDGIFETTVSAPSEPTTASQLQVWQRPVVGVGIVAVAVLITALAASTMMRPEPIPAPGLVSFAIVLPDTAPFGSGDLRSGHRDLSRRHAGRLLGA